MNETHEEPIARSYTPMDETEAAHSRCEETNAERALRDARDGKGGAAPEPPAVTSRQSASPKTARKPAPRGPSAMSSARAWRDRNRELRRRRSLTITDPEEAIAIWRRFTSEGETKGGVMPKGGDRPPASVGDSIDRQVFEKVQLEHDLLQPLGLTLSERIAAWPLPCTFYGPVALLCDADLAAMADADRIEGQRTEERRRETGERLLPGMARQ